ncbi:protein far1-related sequence 5 [Nicotiana attenuata]|uniref:Protein far1-related sequence 5 n=1 Tax=Nicotiana attenuata TaxID=49451 RepID=A0A1J6JS56_NICAT|nr:protein far1-related sequence 5 [Nicotiana attenuata]
MQLMNSTMIHNVYNIDKNFAFNIGMKFGFEEESYNAYNSYAVAKGFSVRKGPKTFNRNKEITRCLFLCSCEGQSDKISPFQERKRQRLEYRCGCLDRIKFKISNGTWEVCEFNDVHSHLIIEENLRYFIQSSRKLTSATKNIIGSMVDDAIRAKKVVRYLQNEAGGVENAGFTEQDAHNFIQAHKRNMISSGDAQTLVNHFMHLQSEDSNFFYFFQVDEDGRLCNFFGRDSISRLQ